MVNLRVFPGAKKQKSKKKVFQEKDTKIEIEIRVEETNRRME